MRRASKKKETNEKATQNTQREKEAKKQKEAMGMVTGKAKLTQPKEREGERDRQMRVEGASL